MANPQTIGTNARGGLAKEGGSVAVSPYMPGSTTKLAPGAVPPTPVTTPATSPTNTAISASSLAPVKGAVVTPPPTPTVAPKLGADIATQNDAFTQAQLDAKTAAESKKTTALDQYLAGITNAQGRTGLESTQYAQTGGVNDLTVKLNDINDQIRREQLSQRRAVEQVQKNVGGGLVSGAQGEINTINRDSLSKQADLSVIQMAAQGQYDSAKTIADRAVSAKLEDQQIKNEALKFNYQENKDLFTVAEQREFETLLGNRNRKLQEEADNKKSIYELGIQAVSDGAPTSVVQSMMAAKTREEALSLGGRYIGALDRAAKQASINASNASAYNSTTSALINRAQAGDPKAAAKLGITFDDGSRPSVDAIAYAQQYASTGQIPTGMPKNISFGQISQLAADMPKATGAIVAKSTGVKPAGAEAQLTGVAALVSAVNLAKQLKELDKQRIGGVVAGSLGKVFGSENQQRYVDTQSQIVDLLARARSGAALTTDEEKRYSDLLPGRFSEPLGFGVNSDARIDNFINNISSDITAKSDAQGWSVYGYTPVTLGGQEHMVGDVIQNEAGQKAIINADGSLTPIQ